MEKSFHIKCVLLVIGILNSVGYGITFTHLKTIEPKLENNEILLIGSIAVNDKNIFITDRKAADIKILDHHGNLVKVFGRKGYGPNEFQQPFTSYIKGNSYYVLDLELDRLSHYKINIRGLSIINNFFFSGYFSDMKPSSGNRFFVAGYFFMDGGYVSAAEFDPDKERLTKKLVLAKQWIGVKTPQEVKKKMFSTYRHLPYAGYIEVTDSLLFYVPGPHLRILMMDKKNNAITNVNGISKRFIEPKLPERELELASSIRSHKLWMDSLQRRSLVLDTFLLEEKFLLVVFSYFNEISKRIELYYHQYDLNGKFIEEGLLLRSGSSYTEQMAFYYDKKNNTFYILTSFDQDDDSIVSRIHRFKVIK